MYNKINAQMGVRILNVIESKEKHHFPRGYPDHAGNYIAKLIYLILVIYRYYY